MTTAPLQTDLRTQAENALADLFVAMPLVTGSVLASTDGHVIAADLDEKRQKPTAAMVASAFALGGRLAELNGSDGADELTVRSAKGFVLILAVGTGAALVILAQSGVNLGLLNLKARQLVQTLSELLSVQEVPGV